jgi:hypothetical protein
MWITNRPPLPPDRDRLPAITAVPRLDELVDDVLDVDPTNRDRLLVPVEISVIVSSASS